MLTRRYHVFVSSTFEDLQQERQEVMHALLELDCIPAGMELFPAANEDQWTLIKRVIDDCDYYLVVVGGRYGSVDQTGMSYTEKEYRYALERGKPIIAFLHKDPGSLPASKTEGTPEGRAKLEAFRALTQKKMIKPWTSPAELGGVVSRAVVNLIKNNPSVGWVRGDVVTDEEASAEILGLKKRIEELEINLAAATTGPPPGTEGLAQGDDEVELHYSFKADEHRVYFSSPDYSATFVTTWKEIFARVSPNMINEASDNQLQAGLNHFVKEQNYGPLTTKGRLKGFALDHFRIAEDDFQTIKVQLRALGLITKSSKPRSIKDTATYWTLTPYGDAVMTRLRAIKKDEGTPAKQKQ